MVPQPVFQASRKDSGRYYCAVVGQEKIKSASVALNVNCEYLLTLIKADFNSDIVGIVMSILLTS